MLPKLPFANRCASGWATYTSVTCTVSTRLLLIFKYMTFYCFAAQVSTSCSFCLDLRTRADPLLPPHVKRPHQLCLLRGLCRLHLSQAIRQHLVCKSVRLTSGNSFKIKTVSIGCVSLTPSLQYTVDFVFNLFGVKNHWDSLQKTHTHMHKRFHMILGDSKTPQSLQSFTDTIASNICSLFRERMWE